MRKIIFALMLIAAPALAQNAGKYQTILGDCAGCHGKNLAGGVVLQTPFGKMVTPNITPDRNSGVGSYSAEDFRKAMKEGVAPGGKRLYPAMPYPFYANMSDADVASLWAYLKTVKPISNSVNVNQLRFPFNLRILMAVWDALFFHPPQSHAVAVQLVNGKVVETPSSARIRGEYLVEGTGHCGACHAPRNWAGASADTLSGASLQGWWAPDLTSAPKSGLASWSQSELVEYLKTGHNAHSLASGPMAEAVENSTSQMTDGDLTAIATYLKALPASAGNGGGASDTSQMTVGAGVYRINCAACHGMDGKGSKIFPPLAGNAVVMQSSAETLVHVVLAGSRGAATAKAPTGAGMPSFAWKFGSDTGDAQVAAVLTYIRNNWGNSAPAVAADDVRKVMASLH
jgi:mono/diheme cytochrome c family protein